MDDIIRMFAFVLWYGMYYFTDMYG